jgi:hypothetical protein
MPAGSVYVTDQRANRVLMLAAAATTAIVLPFAGLAKHRNVIERNFNVVGAAHSP